MRHLLELLSRVAPQRPLWVNAFDAAVTAEQIAESISVDASMVGSRIALMMPNGEDLARSLVALDGVCEAILLLPSGLDESQRDSLMQRASIDRVVSHLADIRCNEELAAKPSDRGRLTRWILATSGTTGTPKLVEHTLATLTRSASFDLTIGAQHTWSSLYNLTGFAGLQVFLQAWCGGSKFVLHNDDATLAERVERMARLGVTAISATPTMWRKILMASDAAKLPLRRITLGGEIADQKILDALGAVFPNAKIRQIYASTEAGVGFSVRDGKAGFPASYLDTPPAGVEVRVEDGRLFLRNPDTSQRFIGNDARLHREDGFIDTGDRVERVDDRFEFLGRANGTINVGGNKVQPEEIERFLLSCDGVVQARVYAKKSPFTGSLVAADVVSSGQLEKTELRKHLTSRCRASLDTHKVPAVIRLVDGIETNAAGKVLRNAG
ncbi:ANL family adenylate-forming protein [Rubripirellula amarantea]|nr:fatty acid--CoA ligase family protein [Rubripirellula amarantea]